MNHHGLTSESDEASSAGRRRYSQTLYNYHNCVIDDGDRLTGLKSRKYINKMVNKKKKFDRKTIFPFFFPHQNSQNGRSTSCGANHGQNRVSPGRKSSRVTAAGRSRRYRGTSAGVTKNVNTAAAAASSATKNGGPPVRCLVRGSAIIVVKRTAINTFGRSSLTSIVIISRIQSKLDHKNKHFRIL